MVELGSVLELLSLGDGMREAGELLIRLLDPLLESLGPCKCSRNRRHVPEDWRLIVHLVAELLSLSEDHLDLLEIILVRLDEDDVLLLELVKDVRAVQQTLETIQQLEPSEDGIAVIETLGEDGGKPTLELLDLVPELIEIAIEPLLVDVHDLVFNSLEALNGLLEFLKDLLDGLRECLSLGSSDLDVIELVELDDGLGEMKDIVAPLEEVIEAHEQRVRCQLPGALRFCLVEEVGVLELCADIDGGLQLIGGIPRVIIQQREDQRSRNILPRLLDNRVAYLPDQDNEPRRRLVVLAVVPDQQDQMHDREEELMERREITRWVQKILKPRKQDLDEGVGVVGLDLGLLDFFLELLEGLEVGAFALEQELQDLLDALGLELLVDAVKVIKREKERFDLLS